MKFFNLKNNNEIKNGSWVPYTIAACSAVILFSVLNNLGTITSAVFSVLSLMKPVLIGIAIAYLLSPLVRFIDSKLKPAVKRDIIRNYIAVALGFIIISVLLTVLLSFLIPQLIESMLQFAGNIYVYSDALNNLASNLAETANAYNLDMNFIANTGSSLVSKLVPICTEGASSLLNRSFTWGGNAASFLIGLILAIYFLVGKKSIFSGLDRLSRTIIINEKKYDSLKKFIKKCNRIFTKFIVDEIIDAIIVGIVNFIFMKITGMPYAILISVICGVTNLAPTFGPFVGAFLGGFILLCADTNHVIMFLIFTLILQLIDGYIFKPRLFAGTMNVPGVWVTVGIVIGGKFFGILGVLLAVPIVGIITFVYRDFIERREAYLKEKRELSDLNADNP